MITYKVEVWFQCLDDADYIIYEVTASSKKKAAEMAKKRLFIETRRIAQNKVVFLK